jgi:hypothetical protein
MKKLFSCFALISLFAIQASAATIVIQNDDGDGEGFNDPNPPTNANQKGNNPGTSLGEMRLNLFESAAEVWANLLSSNITITVSAKFDELACSENSGTVGSAGATATIANFGGSIPSTAYPIALAESLANANLNGSSAEINATFNSLVDSDPNCLGGGGFYYGLDGNNPAGTSNLFDTVLHELAHGLGFASITDLAPGGTGGFIGAGSFPDPFSKNLTDLSLGKTFPNMTNEERKTSALNEPALVWNGSDVTAQRSNHLGPATELVINAPGGIAGTFEVPIGEEPTIVIPNGGVTAGIIDGNNFGDGCSQINEGSFSGKIILFDETEDCSTVFPAFFSEFAANAVGVIIADTTGSGFPDMSGQVSNQEITIPYIGVTKAIADNLRANIGSANVTIGLSDTLLNGENAGMVKMYAPAEYDEGSSVSHFSKTASPDLLMEPILGSLDQGDVDLTINAFKDMGWLTGSPPAFFMNAGLNDAWVSADAPFQGFFFTVYPKLGLFFLSLFTFDSVVPGGIDTSTFGAFDQRWVTGAAFYSGNSVTVPIELTSGGIFNGSSPLASQQKNYGTITITFNHCNEAILTYNFPSLGLSGQMTLTRVVADNVEMCESIINGESINDPGPESDGKLLSAGPTATDLPVDESSETEANQAFLINPGVNDAWVSADAPFQGFFFTAYPKLGLFFLSWFTFDSVVPGGADTATFGAFDQRWVTGAASYSGDSVTMNVELTSGGIFHGSNPLASQQKNYGTITIVFISCNEARLTYNFPGLGLSGNMTLTRVVDDNVELCETMD